MHLQSTMTVTAKPLLAYLTPWLPPHTAATAWREADKLNWSGALGACLPEVLAGAMPLSAWEHHWLTQLAGYLNLPDSPDDLRLCPELDDDAVAEQCQLLGDELASSIGGEIDAFRDSCAAEDHWWAIDDLAAHLDQARITISPPHRNRLRALWITQKHSTWRLQQLHVTPAT